MMTETSVAVLGAKTAGEPGALCPVSYSLSVCGGGPIELRESRFVPLKMSIPSTVILVLLALS